MTLRRGLATLVVALAVAYFHPVGAQMSVTYEVRRGDTLFGVARRHKYEGVSRNQMIVGIWRANSGAFPGGNINVMEMGTVLIIPLHDSVASINSIEADRLVGELLSRPSVPSVAAAKTLMPESEVPPGPISREAAVKRYEEGLALELKGDDHAALQAFLEAGEAGYGIAQRKLGQIYDRGNAAVKRDYQTSLRWYQKARAQGVDIERPLPRTTPIAR
jgi:FimV-like protein